MRISVYCQRVQLFVQIDKSCIPRTGEFLYAWSCGKDDYVTYIVTHVMHISCDVRIFVEPYTGDVSALGIIP